MGAAFQRGVGRKRRGLGPRNDVLTTCKAVTLRGGQRVLAGFFATVDIFREARNGPAEEMIKKPKNHHASLRFSLHIVFVFWY